jgi:hypothetical protein
LNKEYNSVEMADISRLISDVFAGLAKVGIDTEAIWAEIDEVITFSIFAGLGYLEKSERELCPSVGYSGCFQLLGFDVLLDRDLKPHVLEVNDRPSLDFYRPAEKRMKVRMLRELLKIAMPHTMLQEVVIARGAAGYLGNWKTFVKEHPEVLADASERRKFAVEEGNWVQIFTGKNVQNSAL